VTGVLQHVERGPSSTTLPRSMNTTQSETFWAKGNSCERVATAHISTFERAIRDVI
jgi:hypothetical protein